MRSSIRCFSQTFIAIALLAVLVQAEDEFEVLLANGQYGQATEWAERHEDRNRLLGRIALAQAQAEDMSESKSTLRRIRDVGSLAIAARDIRSAANGGALGADFDTLINLITSTVAPNSWEDVGGAGAIAEFPGGVYVDPGGVLRRETRASESTTRGLKRLREVASKQAQPTDLNAPSSLRMVSLARLQRELQLLAAFGEPPTEAMKHFAGLREIQYVFLYPEQNDCVLAGPASDWRSEVDGPPLLLDDFVTLLRVSSKGRGPFSCSITPKRAGLAATQRFLAKPTRLRNSEQTERWVHRIRETLGLQDIEIHGVDPRSHVARVLVEADYHMKLIGMGIEPSIADVPSYLESIKAGGLPESMDVVRWWFTFLPDAIQQTEDGRAFALASQVIGLRSENEQLGKEGERIHTGNASELNQLFAARFTKHFQRIADQHPIYQQLENLFRLSIVASLVQSDQVRSQTDWQPNWFAEGVTTATGRPPAEVPSIVNYRTVNRRHVVVGVSGGVVVDPNRAIARVRVIPVEGKIVSLRSTARPRDPDASERWWWD